ncbi:hypothetical protein D9M68_578040 [compost metagenome]
MQGAQQNARIEQAVDGVGLGQRTRGRDLAVGGERGGAFDAVQEVDSDLARTQLALADGAGELVRVLEMQSGVLCWHGYFRSWPLVSGMRMNVISVITAPAST